MNAQLKSAIRQMLTRLAVHSPGFLRSAVSPKLYEIYVLSLVLRAFDRLNATFQVKDSSGRTTRHLQFRLGPGRLHSPATASGFILVTYNGIEYELQNGVRVAGTSHILHELDVSLIDHERADRCRSGLTDPIARDVRCLIECKFYGGDLGLHLGREFVGLLKEFSIKLKCMSSNECSESVATLIKRHGGYEQFALSPLRRAHVDDQFIPWLAEQLRQVL